MIEFHYAGHFTMSGCRLPVLLINQYPSLGRVCSIQRSSFPLRAKPTFHSAADARYVSRKSIVVMSCARRSPQYSATESNRFYTERPEAFSSTSYIIYKSKPGLSASCLDRRSISDNLYLISTQFTYQQRMQGFYFDSSQRQSSRIIVATSAASSDPRRGRQNQYNL